MGQALTGIRVIDMTSVVVGPMVTLMLADYGATVIHVAGAFGFKVEDLQNPQLALDKFDFWRGNIGVAFKF